MDYFSGERTNFFTKVKIIVSSFFGFLLCASSFRLPMQKKQSKTSAVEEEALPFSISGLKSLISSEEHRENEEKSMENRMIRSIGVDIIRSNPLTHYSSSSFCSIRSCNLLMDDWIGTESGVCLTSDSEEIDEKSTHFDFDCRYYRTNGHDFTLQNQRSVAKRQFPPPIPFLAVHSAGHYRPRSPWILTRYCSNRRLILKLERVTKHQSLESRRENGRLILNLVPIDDQDYFNEKDEGNEEIIESIECEGGEDEGTNSEIAFKSFTYGGEGVGVGGGGGIMFWGVNGNFDERHVVHGHFGSAPLRPMGTVM